MNPENNRPEVQPEAQPYEPEPEVISPELIPHAVPHSPEVGESLPSDLTEPEFPIEAPGQHFDLDPEQPDK